LSFNIGSETIILNGIETTFGNDGINLPASTFYIADKEQPQQLSQNNSQNTPTCEPAKIEADLNDMSPCKESNTCAGILEVCYQFSRDSSQENLNALLTGLFKEQFIDMYYCSARPTAIALVYLGAAVDTRLRFGNTLLHLTSHQGDYPLTKLLLQQGALINAINEGNDTPLHMNMADPGSAETTRLLIEAGADTEAKSDYRNLTPLTLLADNCSLHAEYPSIVSKAELLLSHGANINHRVYSPLGVHYETAAELAERKHIRDGAGSCKDLADFLSDWPKQSTRIQE
jgi:hypothetical protein